ncbi:hypothetical protein FRC12_000201 [Ceratobasidium sp. 428]|nr:hypothetical protein FRC12_000201 [Ceratobasidium sp. 428]
MVELDDYHDIWYLILKHLSGTKKNKKSVLLPITTVSRRLSHLALQRIWSNISSFRPLIALFFDRDLSYRHWELTAMAYWGSKRLSSDLFELGGGRFNDSPTSWSRFKYYSTLVLELNLPSLGIDDVGLTQSTILPIRWLSTSHSKPLLPNLVSITITLRFCALDRRVTSPPGPEWFVTLLSIIPPTLQHAKISWFNNFISRAFMQSVTGYVRGLRLTDLQEDDPGSDSDKYNRPNRLPGDHPAVIPRPGLSSLVSLKGLPLSTHMLDLLAGFPLLSELSLYHTSEEVVPPRLEHNNQPNNTLAQFLRLRSIHIVAHHNKYADICSILSHFPIEQLESVAFEFVEPNKLPPPSATHAMFNYLGNRAHALRMFKLVVDAEKWKYNEPPLNIEGEAYAIAPWPSLSCLLSCHELRSVVVKCAGAYHGCKLDSKRIRDLGNAWPHLSEFCITETTINASAVRHLVERSVLDMIGMEALSSACPHLEILKLTLDTGSGSREINIVERSDSRQDPPPLQLGLGYSVLVREDTMNVARFVLHTF